MALLYPPPKHGSVSKQAQVLGCEECFAALTFLLFCFGFFFFFFLHQASLGGITISVSSVLPLGVFSFPLGRWETKWGTIYEQDYVFLPPFMFVSMT